MNLRALVVSSLLVSASFGTMADQLEVNLSNDTALVQYTNPLSYSGYGRTDLFMGVLYTETDNVMGTLGLLMMGEVGSQTPGLQFGVGFKAYAMRLDQVGTDRDIAAITLGGVAWYVPPAVSRVGLVLNFNYSPSITTFGDAQNLSEVGVRVEYEVLPGAAVYVGYRRIEAELEDELGGQDLELDNGAHVGLRMTF